MPESAGKLRKMVKSKHQYVECNLGSVFSIISSSKQNSAAFQSVVQLLKEGRVGRVRNQSPMDDLINDLITVY